MTNTRKNTFIILFAIVMLAFALLFTAAVAPVAEAEPEGHVHDDVTFTAWTSTTSLPSSAGSYYLTADVTLGGTWTVPTSGTTNLCLNGYGIKIASDSAVYMNGGTFNLYDCGNTVHYFDVSGGKAVNVNATSGEKSFTGGYITGGTGKNKGSLFWNEGGGILVWSGTFNMYGGTILGNSAAHGGGVEVVNATMNLYGGAIMYNTCGEGGAGINVRSESGKTSTLNMYGGSVCYNKGTTIDQNYCYGNGYLNLYGGSISHNTGTGVWGGTNLRIDGDIAIEGNTGAGIRGYVLSLQGSPVIKDNGSGDIYFEANNHVLNVTGALDCEPMSVFIANNTTGVFTSGWSTYMESEPTDYFYAFNADYHVESEDGEAKIMQGAFVYVNNRQGIVKTLTVNKTDTIAAVKQAAATAFDVSAASYKLNYNDEDLSEEDTVQDCGIGGKTVFLLPTDDNLLKTLTLVPVVTTDAAERQPGIYESIEAGDTVTITYKSTQNSGFAEAVFTTAFNEEYFRLTSVAVDENYYSLFNDYGRDGDNGYVAMTLAQHIQDHNASLAAGEEPYTSRLIFGVTYNDGLRDNVGVTSDTFFTVTYSVVKDVPAGVEVAFGLDMRMDGMYTHAAYDDEILLYIIDGEGNAVDEEMVTFIVKNVAEVEIPEDQVLVFHRFGGEYYVDSDDIELTWTSPVFDEENPYLADGGSVNYTFYTKVGETYVRVENGNGEPIVPTAVGDYYVKATLPDTETYLGCETDYVAISVARRKVAVPDLKLYADEASATATYSALKQLQITMTSVTYGAELSLKEIVNNEEADYTLPETNGLNIDDLSYYYQTKTGIVVSTYDTNFFLDQPLDVGTYILTIQPRFASYIEFDHTPTVEKIVVTITIVKAKVTAPTEGTTEYTYNGAEQTYLFTEDGDTDYFTVSGTTRTNAGTQQVSVVLDDKTNYEWEEGGTDDLSFDFEIKKVALTVKTFISGETVVELTYGDMAPAANAFTYVVEGILAAEEEAILEQLTPLLAIAADGDEYEQGAGAGDYVYTTTAAELPEDFNYEITTTETAKITVSKKELTLSASYEGGRVTLSFEGKVEGDTTTVFTYSVDGVDLDGNVYTAVAADVQKQTMVAAITPNNVNYVAAELELNAVYAVTFVTAEPCATAVMPGAQYIFAGALATRPDDPTYEVPYFFVSWLLFGEEYDFSSAVMASLELSAYWNKATYQYKFRALNEGASFATGTYRDLKWENDAFALATESATFEFPVGVNIPTVGSIGNFRVTSWVKAVKSGNEYVYLPAEKFEASVSVEESEDAYYIAIMTLDLGKGDVNGDGAITAADVIIMKKVLVGVGFETLSDAEAVWKKLGNFDANVTYFYFFLFDANGDGYKDARDVIAARKAIVGGYEYKILADGTVNGVYHANATIAGPDDTIVAFAHDEASLQAAILEGISVKLTDDVTVDGEAVCATPYDIIVDLNGKTLTLSDVTLTSTAGSVTLMNGVVDIAAEGELKLRSATGVYTSDLTDANGDDLPTKTGADQNVDFAGPNA